MDEFFLVLFLLERRDLGALRIGFQKLELQWVEGCEEPSVVEYYRGHKGVLVTFAGWTPVAVKTVKKSQRITLPENMLHILGLLEGAAPMGYDLAVITPETGMRRSAKVGRQRLGDPLALGCRYEVRT